MRRTFRGWFAAFALLAGCGDAPPAAESSNVFEPVTEAVDRARSVEATVLEQAEERRRQLEEAESR